MGVRFEPELGEPEIAKDSSSDGWEAGGRQAGGSGRQAGQSVDTGSILNSQGNSTDRETGEEREARSGDPAGRPPPESMHKPPTEPENQKEPEQPRKRTISL